MKFETTRPSKGFTSRRISLVQSETKRHQLTPRAIGVKDTGNTDVDAVLTLETIGQRLCHSLALVVASTGSDRVDMSPAMRSLGQHVVCGECNEKLTSLLAEDEPRGLRKSQMCC